MAEKQKPYVLSIAGFDPSGGAGVLADIKTFEAANVYGLGVVSGITVQNDDTFKSVRWTKTSLIKKQIKILFKKYRIDYVKIGIIKNQDVLLEIVCFLKKINPDVKIVWDPLWKASAGFEFHDEITGTSLLDILNEIYLITPNISEAVSLFAVHDFKELLSKPCSVLISGHKNDDKEVIDLLYSNGKIYEFLGKSFNGKSKHGTGCVLSSAITAGLACGKKLPDACRDAKKYVEAFIQSNANNLGYHKYC